MVQSTAHDATFHKIMIKRALIGVVLALVITLSIISITPGYTYDIVRVEEGDTTVEAQGVTVSSVPHASYQATDILRTSVFAYESGWRFDDYSTTPYHQIDYTNTTDGIRITGREADFRMYRYLNVLVDDYDTVSFSFNWSSVSGPIVYGIRVIFQEGWHQVAEIEDFVSLHEDSEGIFIYDAPLDLLRSSTAHWSLSVRFEIKVEFPETGAVTISDARVKVTAPEPLVPVVVNACDSENRPLQGTLERRSVFVPYANITSVNHSQHAYIMLLNANESIWFPSDYYSIDYGWFGNIVKNRFQDLGSFTLNSSLDSKLTVLIKFNVVQVCFQSNIQAPHLIEFRDYPRGSLAKLYGIWVTMPAPISTFVFPSGYGQIMTKIQVNDFSLITNFTVNTNDIQVILTFPVFNLSGIALDVLPLLFILILTSLLIVIVISFNAAASPLPLSKTLRNPRGVSIILFILSFVVPWSGYYSSGSVGIVSITSVISYCPPAGYIAQSYYPGMTFIRFPISTSGLLLQICYQLALFWLPLLYMVYQAINLIPITRNARSLLPPAVPGIFGLLVLIYPGDGAFRGPGALLSFIAFIVIIIAVTMKWWSEREDVDMEVAGSERG